jgi:muramidase (phage lysozyme)
MSLKYLEAALLNENVQAFMSMLSSSEGTNYPDGYNYLFGSSPENKLRFTDFSKHPNIIETFNNYRSTAAGKWQILYGVWQYIQDKYKLPDFSPHNQDIACVELISERNVLQHTMDGDFHVALAGASKIWASLPYNSFGQPTHPLTSYETWYKNAGGVIAV